MAIGEIQRPRYYYRQYLGSDDLMTEQAYHRDMRRRHNLGPHMWGIVAGLELEERPPDDGGSGVDVVVQPGMAVDGFGREIVLFRPSKLDRSLFTDCRGRQHREVWVTFDEERTQTHIDQVQSCETIDRFGRVRETFRIVVGPQATTHDAIQIAGKAVPPLDPTGGNVPPPSPGAPRVPPDESVPYQELPADELPAALARWLVRLGSVGWDADAVSPDGTRGRFFAAAPGWLLEYRRYVGSVTSEVASPAGALRVKDRYAPSPLPADSSDPHYDGVVLHVEGALDVDRVLTAEQDARVLGNLGVGTMGPKSQLQVKTLTAIDEGTTAAGAWANLGSNSYYDGGWKRVDVTKAGVNLRMNADDIAGQEFRFRREESDGSNARNIAVIGTQLNYFGEGKVGIHTVTPRNPLAIRAAGASQELLSFEDPSGNTKWHINQNFGGNAGLNFVETNVADGRLFIEAGGNVGIDTVTPIGRLHVRDGGAFPNGIIIERSGDSPRLGLVDTSIATAPAWYIDNHGDRFRIFRQPDLTTAGAEFFTVLHTGNVGIGTMAPTVALDVAGKIAVRGGPNYQSALTGTTIIDHGSAIFTHNLGYIPWCLWTSSNEDQVVSIRNISATQVELYGWSPGVGKSTSVIVYCW